MGLYVSSHWCGFAAYHSGVAGARCRLLAVDLSTEQHDRGAVGAGTAAGSLLQALHEGPALREHLHQHQIQVQEPAGVRMLMQLVQRFSALANVPHINSCATWTLTVVGVIAVASLARPALSQSSDMALSGASLLNACRMLERMDQPANYRQAWDMGVCMGAVVGAAASLDRNAFCIPGPIPRNQIVRIAIAYMEQHPERQHYELSVIAAFALREAYPCRK